MNYTDRPTSYAKVNCSHLNADVKRLKKLKIMTVPGTYIYEILLYTKTYESRFIINSILHSYDAKNKIYLLQVITPNYFK